MIDFVRKMLGFPIKISLKMNRDTMRTAPWPGQTQKLSSGGDFNTTPDPGFQGERTFEIVTGAELDSTFEGPALSERISHPGSPDGMVIV
jgi:hypothetical protein